MEDAWSLNYHSESCNKTHLFWTSHEGEKSSIVFETFCILAGQVVVIEASMALTNACDHRLPLSSD